MAADETASNVSWQEVGSAVVLPRRVLGIVVTVAKGSDAFGLIIVVCDICYFHSLQSAMSKFGLHRTLGLANFQRNLITYVLRLAV